MVNAAELRVPRRSSRTLTAIAVGILGLVAPLAACSDDGGSSSGASDTLPSDRALAAIRELTTRVAPPPSESIDLDTCPLGDMSALLADSPAEMQLFADSGPEISQFVYQNDLDGVHPLVACNASFEGGDGLVGINMSEVVPDFKADTERVLSGYTVTFGEEYSYRGGTVLPYCAESLDGFDRFCEVDWYDGNVFTGVFITTDFQSMDVADEWLRAVLPRVLVEVLSAAPAAQPV